MQALHVKRTAIRVFLIFEACVLLGLVIAALQVRYSSGSVRPAVPKRSLRSDSDRNFLTSAQLATSNEVSAVYKWTASDLDAMRQIERNSRTRISSPSGTMLRNHDQAREASNIPPIASQGTAHELEMQSTDGTAKKNMLQGSVSSGSSASAQQEIFSREDLFVRQSILKGGIALSSPHTVSVLVHLTPDRLPKLQMVLERWNGPCVIVLYFKSEKDWKGPCTRAVVSLLNSVGSSRKSWSVIRLLARRPDLYPANHLRNIAWDSCSTDFVMHLDVDLIPDKGLYEAMHEAVQPIPANSKKLFTAPAFEWTAASETAVKRAIEQQKKSLGKNSMDVPLKLPSAPETVPGSIADLRAALTQSTAQPILFDTFFLAFQCLNYDKWYNASVPYRTTYQWPCEPYVVGSSSTMPRFDERFVFYGNDKAQHLLALFFRQFEFVVLPDHFFFHSPHIKADWADHKAIVDRLPKILELTEKFKFESGTEAGVNWHNGIPFAPGTYRIKNGKKVVWNGKQWIDPVEGKAANPLD